MFNPGEQEISVRDKAPRGCSSACSCCRSSRLCAWGCCLAGRACGAPFWGLLPSGIQAWGSGLPRPFLVLLGIRALQALLVPVVLTAVMSGIVVMFRHLDLNCALVGYVTPILSVRCAAELSEAGLRRYPDGVPRLPLSVFLFPCPPFPSSAYSGNAQRQCAPPQPTNTSAVFKGRGSPVSFSPKPGGILCLPHRQPHIPFRMAEPRRATRGAHRTHVFLVFLSALFACCSLRRSCVRLRRQQDSILCFRRLCRLLSHACGPFPLGLVRRGCGS